MRVPRRSRVRGNEKCARAGIGPYSAVGFSMARDDDGDAAVDLDENGDIIWDRTIIYHVWNTAPNQLRRTVFDPRDNAFTDTQRQEQVDSVVLTGCGTNTHNGVNPPTDIVFENLFDWSVRPQGAVFDAYAPELTREANVMLGSCVQSTGSHDFKFSIIGKHANSTGYRVGIDSISASPSASKREGEGQLPLYDQAGGLADYQYMPTGSWDGNYQLMFPAMAVGNFFAIQMENDLWRETNFQTSGDMHDNTVVEFDQSSDPYNFVVKLQGIETNWTAGLQTGDTSGSGVSPSLVRGSVVRVLLRGEEMEGGNWITCNGARCRVVFRADAGQPVPILKALIGEAASVTSNTMDVVAGTQFTLAFNGLETVDVPAGGDMSSDLVDYPIDKEKSYLVTYLVANIANSGGVWEWSDQINGTLATSFVIPGAGSPTAADALMETWCTRGDVAEAATVMGVSALFSTYPGTGTYVSAVFDTHCDAPNYSEINWDASVPSGTDIELKVRTGNASSLSDAPEWDAILPIPVFGLIEPGNGRYAQFQTELRSDAAGMSAPRLKDVTIKWHGPQRMVDIVGTFTKGPDYGAFEVTMDGTEILTGILVDLEIFDDVRGHAGTRRLTSQLAAEICPRNTGL